MVAPAPYAVTILVNDVDVTAYVPYDSMTLDDYARQVSTFRFRIENPSGVTPARQHTVKMTWNADDSVIFIGYIMALETKKRDNGITIVYDCECADRKILLQRTVIGGNEFTGSDIDILGDLLSNAYPDLSSLFDFASDVTSFADGLDLPIEDGTNLLDALNDLADLADADWRFENATGAGVTLVDFDGGYSNYADSSVGYTPSVTTGGLPDNCYKGIAASVSLSDRVALTIDLGGEFEVTNVVFSYRIESTSGGSVSAGARGTLSAGLQFSQGKTATINATWNTFDAAAEGASFPFTCDAIRVDLTHGNGSGTDFDMRIDNIAITTDAGTATNNLQWNNTPDATDFNIDVQTGDEYASDIDFSVGSLDDFNSVTVIGGYEDVSIDKALDNDGGRDHIALPYPVKTLAVYVNTGTDTTPAWGSALALGAWGSDTLTGDGGDKDVLLDSVHNVLFFDTAPPNLVNSYRITGTIQRPIRVRVENVAEGELTLATSYSDETITSIDQAVAIGAAQLEQKNSIRQLRFKTNHPGLKAGQSITVTDSARGLDETVTINRIGVTWLGSGGHAVFDVECGDDDNNLATTLVNIDRQASANGAVTSPNTQTAYLITTDGLPITVDGQPIYSIG